MPHHIPHTPLVWTEAVNDNLFRQPDADLTPEQLATDIQEAKEFLSTLFQTCHLTPEKGLISDIVPDWAPKLIRRKGIAGAFIEKTGSRTFAKRRPENPAPFLAYVEKQAAAKEPVTFRIAVGPLKNANLCGAAQDPDAAEYLTFVQLARLMRELAGIYPHGVKAQIVPDDMRAFAANICPQEYVTQYIAGLQRMVRKLGLENVIQIENGQCALFAQYDVPSFFPRAHEEIKLWQETAPENFAVRWDVAVKNAAKNLVCCQNQRTEEEINASAWRYLVAHRAEILAGLWSPVDAFPIVYANHPNNFQLYTMGFKKTKLPWQIRLPLPQEEASIPAQTAR